MACQLLIHWMSLVINYTQLTITGKRKFSYPPSPTALAGLSFRNRIVQRMLGFVSLYPPDACLLFLSKNSLYYKHQCLLTMAEYIEYRSKRMVEEWTQSLFIRPFVHFVCCGTRFVNSVMLSLLKERRKMMKTISGCLQPLLGYWNKGAALIFWLGLLFGSLEVWAECNTEPMINMLEAHNVWRRQLGVPELEWSWEAAQAAQDWATTLVNRGYEHFGDIDNPNLPKDFVASSGYCFSDSPKEFVDRMVTETVDRMVTETDGSIREYSTLLSYSYWTTSAVGCGKALRDSEHHITICFYERKRTGHGTYTWANGNQYVGDFVDGKRHGHGTYTWANGDQYVGNFVDGKRHGHGTDTWVNGDQYVGNFVEGKSHGHGTYTWANGDQYVGDFVDGKLHGHGTISYVDGTQKTGNWIKNEYIEPKPPVANFTASPNKGAAPLTVTLNANGSHDPDGSIVTYEWRINDALFSSVGTSEPLSFTFEHEGEYNVILIVTDNQGLTATAQQHISVAAPPPPPPQPPVASFTASPTQGQAPLTVTLDGSASSDPDGTIAYYSWWASDGQTASGVTASITFQQPGTYTIHLSVADNAGATSTNIPQQTVIVFEQPKPPVASFTASPTNGVAPLTVTLDANGSHDPDGAIVSYEWSAGGPPFATGKTITNTFTQGEHLIELTVKDNQGLTAKAAQTIIVKAPPPPKPPVVSFTATPIEGAAPLPVTLDASSSHDSDGSIVSYEWSVNGNPFTSGNQVVNEFTQGEYLIELTVKDNQGLTATTSQTILVKAPPPPKPPVASFTATPIEGVAPLQVTLDASGSHDPDGAIVSYEWSAGGPPFATGKTITNTFTQGEYLIELTVTDDRGATATHSETITVTVPPPQPSAWGQAIIVAAGDTQRQNQALYRYTNEFTQRLYRLLNERGFSDADIHYINPWPPEIDLDGHPDEDRQDYNLFEPAQNFAEAFAQAAAHLTAGQQFVFYIHGHARPDHFLITPDYELSASHLRDLLATLPAGVEQIIMLDSCYSGSFLDDLAGVDNRVVITSADAETAAWNTRHKSFSDKLLYHLRIDNQNLLDAFDAAEEMIIGDPKLFREQRPWLDDDGDGQYTSRDGRRAAQIQFGCAATQQCAKAAPPPNITHVHERLTLGENIATAVLWVKTSPRHDGIRQVRAVLINPNFVSNDYQGEATDFGREEINLIYNAAQDRYEIVYDGFWTKGLWRILYQAQNTEGVWSDIVPGEVQAQGTAREATVKMILNQSRYTPGDALRLDMVVNGKVMVDLYVAIVFPDGDFMTLAYPLAFSWPNTIQVYQPNVAITGQQTFSIMDFPLPTGVAKGPYKACGVLVKANSDPNDRGNWIHIDCPGFEVY
jgi:PKD repeat protein